jgi:hypothetical protein
MNKIFLFLILFTKISFSQGTKYHNPNYDLNNGEKYYLFGNDVKFREQPNLESGIIEFIKIGAEITVLEKSEQKLKYNGIESPFYKIDYKGKVGYVLGGLISLEKRNFNGFTYLFTYKKIENKYLISIRSLNKDLEVIEANSTLMTSDFSINIYNNKGLDDIENILYVNYLAEACGIDGGGIYFFRTKERLIKSFEVCQVSDAGIYWLEERLIFPNDKNGVKGKIVYQKDTGTHEDEETNWIEIKKTSREVQWINGEVIPKIEN